MKSIKKWPNSMQLTNLDQSIPYNCYNSSNCMHNTYDWHTPTPPIRMEMKLHTYKHNTNSSRKQFCKQNGGIYHHFSSKQCLSRKQLTAKAANGGIVLQAKLALARAPPGATNFDWKSKLVIKLIKTFINFICSNSKTKGFTNLNHISSSAWNMCLIGFTT